MSEVEKAIQALLSVFSGGGVRYVQQTAGAIWPGHHASQPALLGQADRLLAAVQERFPTITLAYSQEEKNWLSLQAMPRK